MTRYRLAARPIVFCLQRGLLSASLPVGAAAAVPIRLLSTSLPRTKDDSSSTTNTKVSPPPRKPPADQSTTKHNQDKTASDVSPSSSPAAISKQEKKNGKKDGSVTETGVGKAELNGKNREPRVKMPRPVKKVRRRARRLGSRGFGPWGVRYRFMRRGPRTPDFKERKLDPETTTLRWAERKLMKRGVYPIGSRRRRVAIRTSPNLPFQHLPYQCFQEALKVLRSDREEKLEKLVVMEKRLRRLQAKDPRRIKGGEQRKNARIRDMKKDIEELIILADINDPEVKRKSEDGLGDMEKPVYQKLARDRWEEYRKKILEQRIQQFNIVPDVLPKLEISADVELRFRSKKIDPGVILPAVQTEKPPTLKVQLYEPGKKIVTIAVIDSDVPDLENDSFTSRCHFLACNVPLTPNEPNVILRALKAAVPWLPPHSQKGLPYHRLGVYVLEQTSKDPLDVDKISQLYNTPTRSPFSLKSFRDKFSCKPFAFNVFRTVWDPTTKDVMERNNIPGADMQWKRNRDPRIKPLRKRRGWEAKRQGPKYRHLWKYTKRIRGWNDKKFRKNPQEKKWRV